MNEDPVYLINAAIVECVGKEMPGVANSVMRALAAANIELCPGWGAVERLVKDEGAAVTILCENPDGTGPDNHAIEVFDGWTGYKELRFYGSTVFEALAKAEEARARHIAPPVQSDE